MPGKKQSRQLDQDTKRMNELQKRAINDPEVHKQLIEIMEEDPDLVNVFTKHVERKYGSNWNKMNLSQKADLIKGEIAKNRIPRNKHGGRRTVKRKTNKRKTNKRKTNKRKTNKRKTNKRK